MAQALCGDPPVLVLDEPTVGLDPRQVVEIRSLIRTLGKSHTIIFSSHMLPEIQQLCQRVIILHRGKLVREADMTALTDSDGPLQLRARIALGQKQLLPELKALPCVQKVKTLPGTGTEVTEVLLTCDATASPDPQTQLFSLLCRLNAPLHMLSPQRSTLEEAFLRITAADGE